jgi:hypothetical protein
MTAEAIPFDEILIDVGTADPFMHQLRPDVRAGADQSLAFTNFLFD